MKPVFLNAKTAILSLPLAKHTSGGGKFMDKYRCTQYLFFEKEEDLSAHQPTTLTNSQTQRWGRQLTQLTVIWSKLPTVSSRVSEWEQVMF